MVYAVSDLHGYYDIFLQGLEEIRFGEDDKLFVIGDAIDRGPDGIKILEHIRKDKRMDLLLGNHEFMMLNSVEANGKDQLGGPDSMIWMIGNGGAVTNLNYMGMTEEERKTLLFWMCRRPLIHIEECNGTKFCLTHSYYNAKYEEMPYTTIPYEDASDITWRSMYRYDFGTHGDNIYKKYPYTFVTGHVPVQHVMLNKGIDEKDLELKAVWEGNMVDIDGGCAMGLGRGLENGAIFLRLDDLKEFPVPLSSSKDMES